VAELVVAEFANEGGLAAESRDGDGDISGGAAGGLQETRSLRQGDAGDGGNEVDEHLAETGD